MTNKPARERDIVAEFRQYLNSPWREMSATVQIPFTLGDLRELLKAPSPQPDTDVVERVAREHVMPGDPTDLGQIALQWYVNFDWGAPHTSRESNMAVEGFKDGYRAATAALNASTPEIQTQDSGGISGSSSLRSPEPVPVSAHSGDDPGRDALHEALEPFALLLGEDDEDFPDSEPVIVRFGRSTDYSLTLADIRRAATVAHTYFMQSTRDGSGNRSADNPLPLNE